MGVNLAAAAGLGWLAVVSAGPLMVASGVAALGLSVSTLFVAASDANEKAKTYDEQNFEAVIQENKNSVIEI